VIPAPGVLDAASGVTIGAGKSSRSRVPPTFRMTWSISIASMTALPTGLCPTP